ncbi:envelope biogenesis factor ElyC [Oceanisphaera profunda]|uniref:Envelope biogenesis factor ElyC n=1 Tax=Oceanisphaera profunda TaxID=1416627 RepID=A0A1Y0D1J2_9GAMM|nr:envelope biogenesis factor ElyC [Oceanisphaera profunda]
MSACVGSVFLAKKWLGSLLLPLPLLLIISLIGLVLVLKQHKRSGVGLVLFAIMSLCLLSMRPVANALIAPLEAQYPPYLVDDSTPNSVPIQDIIVLGAAQVADLSLPLLSQLGSAGLARISEGIHLSLAYPNARLIVSGYAGGEGRSSAELYSAVAQSFGIAKSRIIELPLPQDTFEEAAAIAPLIKGRQALLVTSASHMPRAMRLFNGQGANPTAAPVGHLAKESLQHKESRAKLPLYTYLPKARYLERSETAWHEYLGLAWQKLNNSAERPAPSTQLRNED